MKVLRVALVLLILMVFIGAITCHASSVEWNMAYGMKNMKDNLKKISDDMGFAHSATPYKAMAEKNRQTTAGIMGQVKKDLVAAKLKAPAKMTMPDTHVKGMPAIGKIEPMPKLSDTKATIGGKASNLIVIFPL